MPCDSPIWINRAGKDFPVPCGTCAPCKIRRVNEWVFRLTWEEERHSLSSHFVTLTYDTMHVPISPHGFMTLNKKDFQDYMKRLRKLHASVKPDWPPIKYYAVGEYGDKNRRPHYHAIIFNVSDDSYFADAWTLNGSQIGGVFVGTCTTDSIAYCMKYIDKQSFRSVNSRHRHRRDDRVLEFSVMSKRLGASYFEDPAIRHYHVTDLSRNYLTKRSGHKIALPRYYRVHLYNKLQLEEQREIIEIACNEKLQQEMYLHEGLYPHIDFHEKKAAQKEGRQIKFHSRTKQRHL